MAAFGTTTIPANIKITADSGTTPLIEVPITLNLRVRSENTSRDGVFGLALTPDRNALRHDVAIKLREAADELDAENPGDTVPNGRALRQATNRARLALERATAALRLAEDNQADHELEEAQALLDRIKAGDIDANDLPEYHRVGAYITMRQHGRGPFPRPSDFGLPFDPAAKS